MDYKVLMYLLYLGISIGLTIWVARTLSRNGLVFLEDVFREPPLAKAINSLLVVGFYLINLGFVTVTMSSSKTVDSASRALETLSVKIGLVLMVLGVLHLFNVFALNKYRKTRLRTWANQPPLPPTAHRPMPPAGPQHQMAGPQPHTHPMPPQGQPAPHPGQ